MAALGGVPLHAAYAASKAAVVSLTQTAALELRPLGLRVNAICPGAIDTPLAQTSAPILDPMIKAMAGISFNDFIVQHQCRWGTPRDVAGAAAFLASDDSTLVYGISLSVDGGIVARVL